MFKIVTVPSPILREPAKPVDEVDDKIKKIVTEMVETLEKLDNPKGVGLAANQVGLKQTIFVFRNQDVIEPVINPTLLWHSTKQTLDVRKNSTMLEGCLSVPFYYGTVKRYEKIRISYFTLEGKRIEKEFKMPESIIIQHEMDHLSGKLFIDLLLKQKGRLYKVEKGK
ncbi:peptide deformylase, partial [Candidatus Microgenomates bacterium]|nr:peptide deformylase [Candidatus Microgenomates bacterium]